MSSEKIKALIQLLDDPDEQIFEQIAQEILAFGEMTLPLLEDAWLRVIAPLAQQRLSLLKRKVEFNHIETAFAKWLQNPDDDLLEPLYLAAKIEYPYLNKEQLSIPFGQLKTAFWLESNNEMNQFQIAKVLNHVIFKQGRFSMNIQSDYQINDCCLHKTFETKSGSNLSICLLYILLAKTENVPLFGVQLRQQNFMLALTKGNDQKQLSDVIFYISPFLNDAVFLPSHMNQLLPQEDDSNNNDGYLTLRSYKEMIGLLLLKMRDIYRASNEKEKETLLSRLIRLR